MLFISNHNVCKTVLQNDRFNGKTVLLSTHKDRFLTKGFIAFKMQTHGVGKYLLIINSTSEKAEAQVSSNENFEISDYLFGP